jgi:hypothetical protein
MEKTLLKPIPAKSLKKYAALGGDEYGTRKIDNLMRSMKGFWQEAAADLLQPRPEAVAQLLKKALG